MEDWKICTVIMMLFRWMKIDTWLNVSFLTYILIVIYCSEVKIFVVSLFSRYLADVYGTLVLVCFDVEALFRFVI